VQRLLDAGADLVGRTISDELAYSLTGENAHYGTPLNPEDPARIPGGSSSGSVSVAAAGVVDFSVGSDCGGSVRLPASYCGILGMRPSHGLVSLDGVLPFAPSFDCVGWFARNPDIFSRVSEALLADSNAQAPIRRLLLATDAFDLLEPELRELFEATIAPLADQFETCEKVALSPTGLDDWSKAFRTLQAAEVWRSVGDWIDQVQPVLGPGVSERLDIARQTSSQDVARAANVRSAATERLQTLLTPGSAIVMPTAPRAAPVRNLPVEKIEIEYRHLSMNLLCCAGLAGLPQISVPWIRFEGLPVGLSIVGARNEDLRLVDMALGIAGSSPNATTGRAGIR
jgi:amidase